MLGLIPSKFGELKVYGICAIAVLMFVLRWR